MLSLFVYKLIQTDLHIEQLPFLETHSCELNLVLRLHWNSNNSTNTWPVALGGNEEQINYMKELKILREIAELEIPEL